jgi:hypothetical protein
MGQKLSGGTSGVGGGPKGIVKLESKEKGGRGGKNVAYDKQQKHGAEEGASDQKRKN